MKRSLILLTILGALLFGQPAEARQKAKAAAHFVIHYFLLVPITCGRDLTVDILNAPIKRLEMWDKQLQPPTAEQLKHLADIA